MAEPRTPSRQSIIHFPARAEFRFSNFIVSEGSRFAYTCAREIASQKPVNYNSLFLCGGPGLGKTHLLLSIGNHLAESGSPAKALYVHCRDLIESLDPSSGALPGKLDTGDSGIDILLLDEIDHIAGHTAAQEALYRIYNQTLQRDGKMVFAGRTSPDRLEATESFITSRFKWGMTAELLPMEDQATTQLIRKLAGDINMEIPDKIISYLLTRIPRDFLTVKNAVTLINEESLLHKRKVTLPLVKTALGL